MTFLNSDLERCLHDFRENLLFEYHDGGFGSLGLSFVFLDALGSSGLIHLQRNVRFGVVLDYPEGCS